MDMQELAREFMAQKRFALVGTAASTAKNGYRIFKNLSRRGSESEDAIAFCRENKMKVVHDICVMSN
jgi:predicted CoA-binding protein